MRVCHENGTHTAAAGIGGPSRKKRISGKGNLRTQPAESDAVAHDAQVARACCGFRGSNAGKAAQRAQSDALLHRARGKRKGQCSRETKEENDNTARAQLGPARAC